MDKGWRMLLLLQSCLLPTVLALQAECRVQVMGCDLLRAQDHGNPFLSMDCHQQFCRALHRLTARIGYIHHVQSDCKDLLPAGDIGIASIAGNLVVGVLPIHAFGS